jgi:hypothetical protein
MIVVCEPQCIGFEHVQVNAALIAVVQGAFPDEEILFLAEEEHLNQAKEILKSNSVEINCEALRVPPRHQSNIERLPLEMRICRNTFALANARKARKILFCSITTATLVSIKMLLRFYKGTECVVIPHDILEKVKSRPSYVPTETLFWFRFWIEFGNSDRLRYLVLSQLIQETLSQEIPRMAKYVQSIDLPYFFKKKATALLTESNIKFAFIGAGKRSKGVDLFFKMAEEVQASSEAKPQFILIGHMTDDSINRIPTSVCAPSPHAPLKRGEFETLLEKIHYVIFLHQTSSYTLTTSGALFDAFSNVKPIIALNSPLFDYYFKKMGDIGYLCKSYDEMKNVILEILESKPIERYLIQQKNVLEGRTQFDITHLSKKLAAL